MLMRIIFLNTFEKHLSEGKQEAQLSIGEKEGNWYVQWLELDQEKAEPDSWYSGLYWHEMLAALRWGIASKMADGYTPIIHGQVEDAVRQTGNKQKDMLHYYAELNFNEELYDELRDWRRIRAVADRKSAYLIANNRMLKLISSFVPHTAEEMLQLPGWGEMKQSQYGEEVLKMTSKIKREFNYPLDWVSQQLDQNEMERWYYKQKEQKYLGELKKQQQKRVILERIHAGGKLKELEKELMLPRRELVMRLEEIEQEGYSVEPLIELELQQVPLAEQEAILEALGALGDRYLKPVLEKVYGDSEQDLDKQQREKIYETIRFLRLRNRREEDSRQIS